jgi:glutathione synthase
MDENRMRVFVFVNRLDELHFRQTTALLIAACVRRNIPTYVASVGGISVSDIASGELRIVVKAHALSSHCGTSEFVESSCSAAGETLHCYELNQGDVILIRTNPGRDQRRSSLHANFLDLAMLAETRGIRVWNQPAQLMRFGSKASLTLLEPDCRPPMLLSGDAQAICDFIGDAPGDCVIKPPLGSRGSNVVRLNRNSTRLYETFQKNLKESFLVTQHYIQAEHEGDQRIVVLDGEVLRSGDQVAGIHRLPAADDFRANLHAGGTAHRVQLGEKALSTVQKGAQLLHRHGIRLAGIDLIGDQIIEFNVFSTGGIYDANRFSGLDFTDDIVARLLGE